ncbi:hypothetical protein NtRootA9_00940 [Arthrobacter sp. NtRootA9]|nr:hypothetical protein NtRootA9_00940 [Arthrobacter sp. NtRootA9]
MKLFKKAVASVAVVGGLGLGLAAPAEAAYYYTMSNSFLTLKGCQSDLQSMVAAINKSPTMWVVSYKPCVALKALPGGSTTYKYYIRYGYN